jgi:sialic acid synthase SpsE
MRIAEAMVKAAASAGVDIVKWQAYDPEKLNPSWPDYERAKDYYRRMRFGRDEFKRLKAFCEDNNVEFLCTAFDADAADMIAGLGCETVKIASPDAGNWPLIDRCLDKFRNLIVSVGMATREEFDRLTQFITYANLHDRITVLHCVSEYPLALDKVNMGRMLMLRDMGIPYGFSDHTMGTEAATLAVSLGATYVEKHLTLSRALPGKDQAVSATPEEFAEITRWRDTVRTMLAPREDEPQNRHYIARWRG